MGFFDKFGSSLIGAGGSILNGIGSIISTSMANKANKQIAAETNASNERINQSQLDYNWDMWNAQNEYNNPSASRKRLTDAGLNPIYYGLDGSSAASGNAYTPIASQQAPATIPNDFSAFGDAALRFAQIKNIEADTKQKESSAGLNTELSETERQVRSKQIVLLGQQIGLNIDTHNMNKENIHKISVEIDSMRQAMDESLARIADYQSQITKRQFDSDLAKCYYELEQRYKDGLLSLQERNLAISWFQALTYRQNADTNYYNAETSRYKFYNDSFDMNATRNARIGMMQGIGSSGRANATYSYGKNRREEKAFSYEQISRAANAYISVTDAVFSPIHHNSRVMNDVLGR